MTKQRDLSRVTEITLKVNTDEDPLDQLGALLPRLDQLRLTGSYISSIRDLGHTTLRALRVLWLSRCGLTDLDGVAELRCLEELYLSSNEIDDVSPLEGHPALRTLDLEGNRLEDPGALDWLGTLPRLSHLCIKGNPLAERPDSRDAVISALPRLETLDEVDVRVAPKDGEGLMHSEGLPPRAQTACAFYAREISPSEARASRSTPHSPNDRNSVCCASAALTYGSDDVLCGNIVSGLRRRRKDGVAKRASLHQSLHRTGTGSRQSAGSAYSSRAPSSVGSVELLTPASSRSLLPSG